MFNYERVIAILPERLGDSLFHTPAIRLLKTQRPDIKLDVIALSKLCAEVLENNPYIDTIYVLPSKHETQRLATRYDATLMLHSHTLARKYAKWLDRTTIPITHCAMPKHWSEHSLDFICELLECAGHSIDARYALFPSESHRRHARSLLDKHHVAAEDILIGCHIGCHSIAKDSLKFWRKLEHPKVWPVERFIELAAELRKIDRRFRLVLTGSKSERALGQKMMRFVPDAINLIDCTSVLDLAALMQQLDLFITGDTGALHVACASDVGIIALFGPTDLQVTGPHPKQPNRSVIQAKELTDIEVSQVVESIFSHPTIVARMSAGLRDESSIIS